MNKVKKILFSFLLICSLIFVSSGVTACNNKNLIPSFPIESTDPEDQTNKDLILSSTIDGVTYDLLSVTAFSNSKYYEIVSGSYYTGIDLVYCFDVTVELSVNNTSSQDIKLAKGAGDSFISYNEEMKFYYDSSEKTIEVTNQLNGDLFDGTITIASKTNKVITMSFDIFLQGPLYYDLNNYYPNMPVINSGIAGNTTEDILDEMQERVYQYNPSKIFLLIGTNDIEDGVEEEDIIHNIEEILQDIHENRPYAELYLEAIYPVDEDRSGSGDRTNEVIVSINEELEKYCKDYDITFIDTYDLLLDSDSDEDKIVEDYSKDGLHLTDEGYEVVTDEIMKYLQ